ncbi:hypothetical protein [Halomonas denitrificans]|nr:hypothetical protein [Halomonas denitrificans]
MKISERTKSRWAAYFGGATVVASLLLVAWEIRQNTVALTAQSLQDLNAMANEILMTAAESSQLSEVLVKGDEDLSALTGAERSQYWAYNYGVINAMDAAFGFYEKGILDEADYSGWRRYTCDYLSDPSVRVIWDEDKATFGTEFSAYVEAECGF